jgi:hypothetical protein
MIERTNLLLEHYMKDLMMQRKCSMAMIVLRMGYPRRNVNWTVDSIRYLMAKMQQDFVVEMAIKMALRSVEQSRVVIMCVLQDMLMSEK